uniref:WGR domain-containing protein n=1 Tax=Dulem virus 39 TaxID=3145757 RepID=A0AAU8B6F0_9CAUD
MRIISQDGMIDVPYEMIALHECDGKIRMNMAGDTGKGTVLAEYSTEAKARKAMEMLHEAYICFSAYKQMSKEQKKILVEVALENERKAIFGLFQFPADDEVEV